MESFLKDYIGRCSGYDIQPKDRIVNLLSSYIKKSIQSNENPNNLKLNGDHDATFTKRLTDIDIIPLCELLEDDTLFASADFSFNHLTNESAINAISSLVKSNYVMRYLSLRGNSIEEDGAVALSNAIQQNTSLECLDLSLNSIGEKGGIAIVDSLAYNTSLSALNLTGTDITLNTLIKLSLTLADHPTLSILSIGRPLLKPHANINTMLTHFSNMLKRNTVLQVLDMSKSQIRCDGLRILLDGIKTSNQLKYLNLRGNLIGVDGACYLADYLQQKECTLSQLILSHNHIDRAGGNAMALALQTNTSLKSLDLVSNKIGDMSLFEIANSLLNANQTLMRIKLKGNLFGQRSMQKMFELHEKIQEILENDDVMALEMDVVPYFVHATEGDFTSPRTFYLADANHPEPKSLLESELILQLVDDIKEQQKYVPQEQYSDDDEELQGEAYYEEEHYNEQYGEY